MFGDDIPAFFADEESLRRHFPSLDNGELLNTAPSKEPSTHGIVGIRNTVAVENVVRNVGRVEENLEKLVEVTTWENRSLKKAPKENESGSRSKKRGRARPLPSVRRILGPTDTVANENVRENFGRDEEKNQENMTAWGTVFEPDPKKTRFVKKATKNIPVSYEYLTGLAVQNGAQIASHVYDFILVHAPVVARISRGKETWKNSAREKLSNGKFFTKELLSLPHKRKLNGYSMSSYQVFQFRRKYPFHYGFPKQWLRDHADFEAIYFGKKGLPSEGEVKRAHELYNMKTGHSKPVWSPRSLQKRPTTHEGGKTTGKIARILDEYETDADFDLSFPVRAADSDRLMGACKSPSIYQMTHPSSGHLAEIPATAACSEDERLFLTSVTSPSGVDFAAYFEGPQKIAPYSLQPIHSNSTTPFEQTTYNGLSNLNPITPKQLRSMNNDCAEAMISFYPIANPYCTYNGISNESFYQMEGVDTAIAPQQIPHCADNESDSGFLNLDSMPQKQLSSMGINCTETPTSSIQITNPYCAYYDNFYQMEGIRIDPQQNFHYVYNEIDSGLLNIDSMPPKQLSPMDNDCAGTLNSYPPSWNPYNAYNEIPRENSHHQMRGVDPAIAPEQIYFKPTADAPQPMAHEPSTAMAEITRGSYESMHSRRIFANEHVDLWNTHPEPFTETWAPEKCHPQILQTEGTQPQQTLSDWFSNFDCEEEI